MIKKIILATCENFQIISCELCGFSFDERMKNQHECDSSVLENKERLREQDFEKWRRSELDALEADEMYLRDF
mgnify:CR=1 FL=1